MTIWTTCRLAIRHGTFPRESLVVVDAGMRPIGLPELTLLESLILSPLRPIRYFALTKPHASRGDSSALTEVLRAHVVAYPNPPPGKLGGVFPLRMGEILQHSLVVLISAADTIETARKKAKKHKRFKFEVQLSL